MSTKSTHSKKNFSKKNLATKLDSLVETVSQRGVFVIKTSNNTDFSIINYLTGKTVLAGIPTAKIADHICNKYNKTKVSAVKTAEYNKLISAYNKLLTDCIYYDYTIKNSEDLVLAEVAQMRKANTRLHINKIKEDIEIL